MNNLVEFLQDIRAQGWQLWSENGQLCYDAPKNNSTDSILGTLKQHKTEILQLLAQIEFQETPKGGPVIVPLTEAQKQFWFLDQLEENSRQAYIDQVCLHLEGRFNINAMEQAIKKIVERHEALRTRISSEGDFQEVLPEVEILVPLIDFSNWSDSDRESQITEWLEEEIQKPFDLSQAPLLRGYILKIEEKLHRLVLRIHHIINDGLSTEIILKEIVNFYAAKCEEKVCQLEPPMQFREYVEWQNNISKTEEMAVSESYWLDKFSTSIPILNLPTDRPRPSIMTYRGSRQTLKLDGNFFAGIKTVSRQKGCTLFMTLLATYKILLSKLTGDEEIIVGTAARGRDLEGSQNMIGYCNNVLPIRSSIDESLSFSEFLIRTRSILLNDYQNQDYPFPKLLTKLNLERDPSRPILVSTLFNLDRIWALPNISGLKTRLIPIPKKFVPYDIVLDITETENELLFNLDYNLDLFDDSTIERWLIHFQTLLEAIITDPEQKITQLSLLTAAEKQQLLEFCGYQNNRIPPNLLHNNLPIYILDAHQQMVPPGVEGEIYISTSLLAQDSRDIYQHPQLGLLQKTQQWGRRLSNGFIEWKGDITRIRKVKGNRINLQEIEVFLRSHPEVKDCYILVRNEQIIAYLEVSKAISPELLRTEVKHLLPGRHLQPDAYVQVSTLPLTASGKIDEKALESLEVIDSNLIESWEEKLLSHPEIKQAAVVVEPKQGKVSPPFHILDLIPETITTVKPSVTTAAVPLIVEEGTPSEELTVAVPALSDGGQLIFSENAPQTLAEALQRAAQQDSERGLIYINSDGLESIQSYADLLRDAEKILAGLRKIGLQPQDKVIFQLPKNQDFISAFWGCVLGGFIPVPVSIARSYDQPNTTLSKLQNSWQILGKPLVLTDSQLAPKIQKLFQGWNLEDLKLETLETLQKCEPDRNWYKSKPENLAVLLLTSGSTGMPKAVMQSHRSLLSRSAATSQMNNFTSEDISLNWFPLDHVGGIVMFHLRDVYLGCQQIQAPIEVVLEAPTKWLDWISEYGVTITWAPNFAYGLVVEQIEKLSKQGKTVEQKWNLSSLKFLLNGGEAIAAKSARRFLELLIPYHLPAQAMHPAWGMSETSSGVAYSHNFLLESTTNEQKFVEVGAPTPGTKIRIVDNQDQLVGESEIGSVQIQGVSVTSGYYQNPVATKEAFTKDDWFNTGDLGFLKAGQLTITGRQKDVIIINGLNYYSHEIEAVVEELAGIEVSYTAACAIREYQQDTDKLAIFFSTQKTEDNDLIELLQEIRSVVVKSIGINPDYLIPVEPEKIPKTAIGKIQRTQLKQRFESGEFKSIQKRVDILQKNYNTIPRWFYRSVWRHKEVKFGKYPTDTGITLIFVDSLGLGNLLWDKLQQNDRYCLKIEASSEFKKINENNYFIAPDNPQHYRQLLESITAIKLPIIRIINLFEYQEYTEEIVEIESGEKLNHQDFFSLFSLIKTLEEFQGRQHQVQLLYVSSYSQLILETDKIACEKSTVLGLLKTIPQEMPWLNCRHLDLSIADIEINSSYIWQELCNVSPELEIAYREGKRLVSGIETVNLPSTPQQKLPFQQGGTYLLSGGLGGIGREIAKYLLENYQAKLILVGRTPLSASKSDKMSVYQQLQKLGTVTYEAVDICNLEQLQQVVKEAISEWGGKLDGVIHLAGVFHEQLLLTETQESVARVLRPKVIGSWVLHQLLKDNADGLFIHFASVNGFFGGMSVGAYAAANSFQMAFCNYQKTHSNLRSYCLAWSMWDETGMSQGYQMKELSQAKGFYSISPLQGMYSLLAALYHGENNLLVGLDGSKPLIQGYGGKCDSLQQLTGYLTTNNNKIQLSKWFVRDRFGLPTNCQWVQLEQIPLTETGEIDRSQLMGSGVGQRTKPRNETERQLVLIFQEVLGISSVGVHDNFFELKGDSLKMTQVVSRVRETFNVELPLSRLFESPTVDQLSSSIDDLGNGNLSLAEQLQNVSNEQENWEEIEL
ncbi:SDR family NAD(P)-dependent oxidoreductase [Okeania sp. SIO1I7]|uniref:SDR family NAD(P)-dependent oxidoreductase n=1 Tax=Okeania sp. SIO1I7 TaxID=2607772 RepID=UPI0013F7D4EF|nr:SDR family NAD(P)-dependent oxidoreductase [Okeania sp. SIO1I7]NET25239.1 SDR family NAD(P)-dependent oxidoreductase [Okeania sp. SIO1I7]